MADGNNKREDDFLQQQEAYRRNAFNLIFQVLDWCKTPETKPLVDEMLHSIFFLARICAVPFSPGEIIPNDEMLNSLEKSYPGPFKALSQLPRRTPFSSVLDMIVLKETPENENKIKESLKGIVNSLEATFPVSSTICVSQNTKTSSRYYGVSMATTGPVARRIMIAASCCGPWDDYVAGAVMTYVSKKKKKKGSQDFVGTIQLPDYVRCETFNLSDGKEKKACRSCGNLFGLSTTETKEWPYGNCAEAESLSNLLKGEKEVKKDVKPTSEACTDQTRKTAQCEVLDRLVKVLRNTPLLITWKGDFYSPKA